jgi:hypothetical protein
MNDWFDSFNDWFDDWFEFRSDLDSYFGASGGESKGYFLSIAAAYAIKGFESFNSKAAFTIKRDFSIDKSDINYKIKRDFSQMSSYAYYKIGLLQPPPIRILFRGYDD